MESFGRAKPYMLVILLQFASGVLNIIVKAALNDGMSQHVLVVYRMGIASVVIAPFAFVLERKSRPKMTLPIFAKIMLLSLFEPVTFHNLFYSGMKNTSANFSAAIFNIVPAIAFILAWTLRLENVKIKELSSQAKVIGTVVTIGGTMLMTLVKGKHLILPWTNGQHVQQATVIDETNHKRHFGEGAVMIISACFIGSTFLILQAFTLKSYPAKLSLTALQCIMGMVEGTGLAVAVERGNTSVWCIQKQRANIIAVLYGGLYSGVAYYIMALITKKRGPVFVSASSPLSMVVTTIIGSSFLREQLYMGRILGAIVAVIGLYLVLWGKSKDQPQQQATETDKVAPNQETTTNWMNDNIGNTDIENATTCQETTTMGFYYANSQAYCYHLELVLVSKKLKSNNNNTWSREMRIALNGKNKIDLIDGTLKQPILDKNNTWQRCNDMVLSWIIGSLQ
ncbi:WAT1-related protein At2g39510-like [Tripterygium wilfordii]|uniref:WAT1-related protein At2g39510-like n=1 Tax=Tripterygium wilfordii TaxID=458696 RepID=UPI0018F7EFDF|nr:WAT1-related protein At2g39510-like [Tripterygium wilfordii]